MAELVFLDEYKIYKNLTSTEDDARREDLILKVSQLVETYCNRKFIDYVSSPVTEYFNAMETDVYLSHFPVINVEYVGVSTDGGINYTELTQDDVNASGFFVYPEEGKISTQVWGSPFAYYVRHPYKSLKVTYTAGYTALPEDLKTAVYDLVHYYEHSEHTVSKSLNASTLENPMPYNNINFPPHITRILNQYRVPYAYSDVMG